MGRRRKLRRLAGISEIQLGRPTDGYRVVDTALSDQHTIIELGILWRLRSMSLPRALASFSNADKGRSKAQKAQKGRRKLNHLDSLVQSECLESFPGPKSQSTKPLSLEASSAFICRPHYILRLFLAISFRSSRRMSVLPTAADCLISAMRLLLRLLVRFVIGFMHWGPVIEEPGGWENADIHTGASDPDHWRYEFC